MDPRSQIDFALWDKTQREHTMFSDPSTMLSREHATGVDLGAARDLRARSLVVILHSQLRYCFAVIFL